MLACCLTSDTPQQTNDNDRDPGTEVVLVRSCLRNTDGVYRLGWRLTERGEVFRAQFIAQLTTLLSWHAPLLILWIDSIGRK